MRNSLWIGGESIPRISVCAPVTRYTLHVTCYPLPVTRYLLPAVFAYALAFAFAFAFALFAFAAKKKYAHQKNSSRHALKCSLGRGYDMVSRIVHLDVHIS